MKNIILFLILSISTAIGQGSENGSFYDSFEFNEQDSIRGALRLERSCYDVLYYDLSVDIDPREKSLIGSNIMTFKYLEKSKQIQLDLFKNMIVDEIIIDGEACSFKPKYDALFIDIPDLVVGQDYQLKIKYQGMPIEANMPPWDGGFVWSEDERGTPWVGVACEGTGASLWWPNKDHLSDEPDSMRINITVPSELMAVSNGNLIETIEGKEKSTYVWNVSYPINNYNVSINVGDYIHFSDEYVSPAQGKLACDYYVLNGNLKVAKEHFSQVEGVLEAFENYFGPYPFWRDGYALIETPYLGMEHQSGIAYGNQYKRGYLGSMIPQDMNWDYIIVHETGHEYWGNSISVKDHADMWIHEGFTTYMEALYVEYHYGREAVDRYLAGQRNFIQNTKPVQGPRDVNFEDFGGSDHYYKGSYMLHTLRHVINDDETWWGLLRAVYEEFKFSTVESEQIIDYISDYCTADYHQFFEQYLDYGPLPILECQLKQKGKHLVAAYRWNSPIDDFSMPIEIGDEKNPTRLECTTEWSELKFTNLDESQFWVNDIDFLIETMRIEK